MLVGFFHSHMRISLLGVSKILSYCFRKACIIGSHTSSPPSRLLFLVFSSSSTSKFWNSIQNPCSSSSHDFVNFFNEHSTLVRSPLIIMCRSLFIIARDFDACIPHQSRRVQPWYSYYYIPLSQVDG